MKKLRINKKEFLKKISLITLPFILTASLTGCAEKSTNVETIKKPEVAKEVPAETTPETKASTREAMTAEEAGEIRAAMMEINKAFVETGQKHSNNFEYQEWMAINVNAFALAEEKFIKNLTPDSKHEAYLTIANMAYEDVIVDEKLSGVWLQLRPVGMTDVEYKEMVLDPVNKAIKTQDFSALFASYMDAGNDKNTYFDELKFAIFYGVFTAQPDILEMEIHNSFQQENNRIKEKIKSNSQSMAPVRQRTMA